MLFFLWELTNDPLGFPIHISCFFLGSLNDLYDFNPVSLTSVYTTDYTLFLTLKLIFCLLFLILIRGGVPRYRYDFLTKIGWVKFLGYVLAIFIFSFGLFFIW